MELDIESKSEVLFEVENMEDDRSVVSSKDGTSNGKTAEIMTKAKIRVSDKAKLSSKAKNDKVVIPCKPVVVLEISDVAKFTNMIENECNSNFIVDIAGRWLKNTTNSSRPKPKFQNS